MFNADKIAKNILVGKTCSECIHFSGLTTFKCKKITIEENKVEENNSCILWHDKGSVSSQDEIDELLATAFKNTQKFYKGYD